MDATIVKKRGAFQGMPVYWCEIMLGDLTIGKTSAHDSEYAAGRDANAIVPDLMNDWLRGQTLAKANHLHRFGPNDRCVACGWHKEDYLEWIKQIETGSDHFGYVCKGEPDPQLCGR